MTPDTPASPTPVPASGPVLAPAAGSHRVPDRRWRRRVPALVWAVTALHIALMALCTVLYPAFAGLDETTHVDMVYAYSQGHGPYPPGGRLLSRGVEVAYGNLSVPPKNNTTYSDTPIAARDQRPSFDAAGGDVPSQTYLVPNQMVQHPPLYYVVEAAVLKLPGVSDLAYDRQVTLLRWVSLLMLAPLPLLIWATGRRLLGPDSRAPALAAVVPATIPGLSRLGGSVNNDNLLILLAAVLALVVARVLGGDLRKRTGAVVGLVLGLALLTKGLALVLPVFVAAAYLVAWSRHRRPTLVPLALAAGVSAVVGGWWWARNLVLYGAVQPSGLGPVWTPRIEGPPRPGFSWSRFVPEFVERLSMRFWGGLGYPDTPIMPKAFTGAWLALFVAAALVGVGFGLGGRRGRLAAATLLLPAIGLVALIFIGAGNAYVFNGRLPGIQGRYVYAGLTPLAVLFALGLTRLAGRAGRVLPLLLVGAGVVTQAWAWRLLISAWWVPRAAVGNGEASARGSLAGIERWSPWPDWATRVPFAAVPLLALVALAVAVAGLRRDPRPEPAGDAQAAPGPVHDGQVDDGQVDDGRLHDGQAGDGQAGDGQPRDGQPRDGRPRDGRGAIEDDPAGATAGGATAHGWRPNGDAGDRTGGPGGGGDEGSAVPAQTRSSPQG